jgi:hypothetical protein
LTNEIDFEVEQLEGQDEIGNEVDEGKHHEGPGNGQAMGAMEEAGHSERGTLKAASLCRSRADCSYLGKLSPSGTCKSDKRSS